MAMKKRGQQKHKSVRRRSRKRRRQSKDKLPTTLRQYLSMSQRDQEKWDSVGQGVSRIRAGATATKAAKDFDLNRATLIEWGRPGLKKRKNGRYVAKKFDRLLRVVQVLSTKGKKQIATRDSRQASAVGGHWAAVQKYLQTGDDSALLNFKGKKVVDASSKRHLLLTDLKELDRLASAGVLSFESLYAGGSR